MKKKELEARVYHFQAAEVAAAHRAEVWSKKYLAERNERTAGAGKIAALIKKNEELAAHQAKVGDYVGARTHQVRAEALRAAWALVAV